MRWKLKTARVVIAGYDIGAEARAPTGLLTAGPGDRPNDQKSSSAVGVNTNSGR